MSALSQSTDQQEPTVPPSRRHAANDDEPQTKGPQDQSQPNPADDDADKREAKAGKVQAKDPARAVANPGDPGTQTGNPSDMTGNSPQDATEESVRSNVTLASEGQKRQVEQTVNKDPNIGDQQRERNDADQVPEGDSSQNLGAKLTSADPPSEKDTPSADVDEGQVRNGGIRKTDRVVEHSSVLQGLSAERRKQQLEGIEAQAKRG